ncbi:fidgetin-like protein 1 [Culicoides brevitarsis]|uniref:fidgetin-like protein 1 n=1 Tax=Culicoides brevitarsis TaxID=469753 RepID=UPI00307C820E
MPKNRNKTRTEEEAAFFKLLGFTDAATARALQNREWHDEFDVKANLRKLFLKNKPESNECECLDTHLQHALKRYRVAKRKKKSDKDLKHKQAVGNQESRKTCENFSTNIKRPEKTNIPGQQPDNQNKANTEFRSAREECIRQAKVENRPPPVIASRPVNQPVRRYMGNRLVTIKPNKDPQQEQSSKVKESESNEDEFLKGIDKELLEIIKVDVLVKPSNLTWEDIKGLEFAKETMMETIVYPIQRPDLFIGLRRPSKGVLMFGPPGTGKTLIARCIANNANATFFNISASSLTSKWIGQGEKMVRTLFTYARFRQPSVIFIDEVDSLLSQRSDNEHESSRRLKTEFLIFLDGCGTDSNDQVLLIAATNRPGELDEAARRRFTKRLYIPLPEKEARIEIIKYHLNKVEHDLKDTEIEYLASATEGFSGADLKVLAETAGMIPMRDLFKTHGFSKDIQKEDIPPVNIDHFERALKGTRPSVSKEDVTHYIEWNKKFGSTDGY